MWAQHALRTSVSNVPHIITEPPINVLTTNNVIQTYEPSNFVTPNSKPFDPNSFDNNPIDPYNEVPFLNPNLPDFPEDLTPTTKRNTISTRRRPTTRPPPTTRFTTRPPTTTSLPPSSVPPLRGPEENGQSQLFTSPPRGAAVSQNVPTSLSTSPPRTSAIDYSECGISGSQPLVIGGTEVKPGEFPWLVAIILVTTKTNYEYVCTGNLITKKHVLTGKIF